MCPRDPKGCSKEKCLLRGSWGKLTRPRTQHRSARLDDKDTHSLIVKQRPEGPAAGKVSRNGHGRTILLFSCPLPKPVVSTGFFVVVVVVLFLPRPMTSLSSNQWALSLCSSPPYSRTCASLREGLLHTPGGARWGPSFSIWCPGFAAASGGCPVNAWLQWPQGLAFLGASGL